MTTISALPLQHALAYVRVGLPVFPLKPRDKVPACENGMDDATLEPDQVRAWWHQNPRYNIGIRPPEHIVVIDIDPRHGGSLEQLGTIPETWTARTGGNGLHLWFQYRARALRGKLAAAEGVDVKGHNGYLVVPPSVHPDTGLRYEWANRAPIAWMPAHLRSRVERPKSTPRQRFTSTPGTESRNEGLVRTVATAAPGNRNQALYWAACRWVEQGADPELRGLLEAAAATAGLDANEIERTLASAERRQQA